MKKKPDRKVVAAVLVLLMGATAAKGLEVQKSARENASSGASTAWLQSPHQ